MLSASTDEHCTNPPHLGLCRLHQYDKSSSAIRSKDDSQHNVQLEWTSSGQVTTFIAPRLAFATKQHRDQDMLVFANSTLLCAIAGVAITCWLARRFLVYPAFLSPLARVPCPHWSCSVSDAWYRRQEARSRGLKTLLQSHTRPGPIIRLGPNEVSVVSDEGLSKIYTAGLDKSPWYQKTFFQYGARNLVSTLDHVTHAKERRIMAKFYNKSYLQRCRNLASLSDHVVRAALLPRLELYSSYGKAVDVMRLFTCVGVDMVSGHTFGSAHGTDTLVNEAKGKKYADECAKDTKIQEGYFEHIYRELLSRSEKRDGQRSSPSPATALYDGLSAESSVGCLLAEQEIFTRSASEFLDHIIATQETNTITWTYICYRLSLHPQLEEQLRAELHTLEPRIAEDSTGLPSPASIDKLPLLDAVIHETLRLHAANPARMPRVAPPSGMTLHGYGIPAGTIVSTNAYCLHRNLEVFPEPLQWQPERWMPGTPEPDEKAYSPDLQRMRRWFWAFGSGTRNCIAQHFAIQTIKLVIASIYTTYTTHIVDDEGIEQSDSYNSGPVGGKLILRFQRVGITP